MSRLLLLAAAGALAMSAAAQAVVVFEPTPVPQSCGSSHYDRLNSYYHRQLNALNWYSSQGRSSQAVIDLYQRPCVEENNYWRKRDLMPVRVEGADEVRVRTDVSPAKGTVLIVPKAMLDRKVKDVDASRQARQLSRAE